MTRRSWLVFFYSTLLTAKEKELDLLVLIVSAEFSVLSPISNTPRLNADI